MNSEKVLLTYVNFLKKYVNDHNIKLDKEGNFYDRFPFANHGKCANLLLGKQSDIDFMQNYINVTTDINIIEKYYNSQECIVLREYNNETILVIGCGSVLNYQDIRHRYDGFDKHDKDFCKFSKNHKHIDHYTIDPDIVLNPSTVGFFGYQIFMNIPDGSFKKIIFEGFYPEGENKGPYFDSELKRLLKKGYSNCIYITSSDKEMKEILKDN
jgi:hypothetical protein